MTKTNEEWKGSKKDHEWGVIAQERDPYREYHFCPLCNKVQEITTDTTYTLAQFNKVLGIREVYQADSSVRLTEYQ